MNAATQVSALATTPVAKDCLKECVRGGSPLVILSEDGFLYVPISSETPDKSVRSQLLPYAGKYVKASGKLFERGGLHSISIEKIEPITRPQLQNPHFLSRQSPRPAGVPSLLQPLHFRVPQPFAF
jgi:hypothetical protein